MDQLILTIKQIIKYGLYPDLNETDSEMNLEKNLVKIYALYFDITYTFDNSDFPDFDKSQLPDIRQNVRDNFKNFGFYKIILNIHDINNLNDNGVGDAIDDLCDIIIDLLEVKWRVENNCLADGLWFFEFIFNAHTQQHILNLLNYMKQKNSC